jgi:putative tryptophan/tyrosine transport system substrate-binding protein
MTVTIGRRELLAALGGAAAAWPLAARAQQPAMPVVGFLSSASPRAFAGLVAAFREGLQEQGYAHGRNVFIDHRWAEGHYQDLPDLAADLVARQVNVIAATGGVVSALAAKKATTTIPIVFVVGFDPVQLGLVASLNAPGGNATGVNVYTTELANKRLELLQELLKVDSLALIVNPSSLAIELEIKEVVAAARRFSLDLLVLRVTNTNDLNAAFQTCAQRRINALLISADPFFNSQRDQIVSLAAQHAIPTMYPLRAFIEAGGLVSYGTKLTWAYHQIGVYAGRILKGEKPANLPVQQPTRFDLVINLKTAKTLGLEIPDKLLALADEVIE